MKLLKVLLLLLALAVVLTSCAVMNAMGDVTSLVGTITFKSLPST